MKVCVFRATDGACDFYRVTNPVNTAATNKAIQRRELWIANVLITMEYEKEKFMDAMQSDIYFLQRISDAPVIEKLRSFAREAKIDVSLLMDYDDDVFHVSPFSNHYVDYGLDELTIINHGKIIHEWKNGVNIDLKQNQRRIDGIKRACSAVDMLTTTTEHLAKVYREYNDNVKVLPNCVDLKEWNRLQIHRKNSDEIRICWQGGHSHWEDLYLLRNVLRDIAKKYKNVKILMVGYMPVSMKQDFRPEQLEFHPWVETPAHPYRLAALDIDIAVIPLKDTIFNRSKSIIKWVEFSALEIPSVTSYVMPYDSIQSADDDCGFFVENNNDEKAWMRGIELLINDVEKRRSLGKKARQFVVDNYDINTQYHQWIKAFEEVKCQSPLIHSS